MTNSYWTPERDKHLQKLEAAGLSATQIAARLGTTRNAVIGRSARLRHLVFPSQMQREKREKALAAERRQQKKRRIEAALAAMRRAIAKGTPRAIAIAAAVHAHATCQAVGNALGLSRQRVHQIVRG
jgi:hypothetical protein